MFDVRVLQSFQGRGSFSTSQVQPFESSRCLYIQRWTSLQICVLPIAKKPSVAVTHISGGKARCVV